MTPHGVSSGSSSSGGNSCSDSVAEEFGRPASSQLLQSPAAAALAAVATDQVKAVVDV